VRRIAIGQRQIHNTVDKSELVMATHGASRLRHSAGVTEQRAAGAARGRAALGGEGIRVGVLRRPMGRANAVGQFAAQHDAVGLQERQQRSVSPR
jgi:hypothetical protein